MASLNHTHQFVRVIGRITKANQDSKFINFYKCRHPQCTYRIQAELILGKMSICNRCGKEFILPLAVRFLGLKPHCKDCTRVPYNPNEELVNVATND